MQNVLYEDCEHHGHEDGILKPKDQLDRGSPGEDAVVGMADKQEIQDAQQEHQRDYAEMKEPGDVWTPLHKVHPVLSKPVEALEEQEESEEGHKAGTEVISEDGEGQASFRDRIP